MDWFVPVLMAISAEDYRRLAPVAVHVLVFIASVCRGVWSWWKGGRSVMRSQPTVVYIIIMTAAPMIVVVGQHSSGRG